MLEEAILIIWHRERVSPRIFSISSSELVVLHS